jgi:erythromycin esterase-like protein
MWRNADVLDFVGWLRARNDATPAAKVGFYGMDLYSLHASIEAVLSYLRVVDPEAAVRATQRYACFDHFGGDAQRYGYAASLNLAQSCETEVIRQLRELRETAAAYASKDGRLDPDAQFAAEQNARLVVHAEQYYRAMFRGRVESWNLRDTHMADVLQRLSVHLSRGGTPARLVVWAHNSHLGDASATELGDEGELNVGQLARQIFADQVLIVGFSTFEGTVTAASDWGENAERMRVRPALEGSMERLFHETGMARFALDLRRSSAAVDLLRREWLQRAIGVIYRPRTERLSHYFGARPADQFDFLLHYDVTRALEPLERTPEWVRGEPEMPETYPSAL